MPESADNRVESVPQRGLASARFPILIVLGVLSLIWIVLWFWTNAQEKRALERGGGETAVGAEDPLERESAARERALLKAAGERRVPFLIQARRGAANATAGAFRQRAVGEAFDPTVEAP